jgi:DNA-binding transcriptional regulator PaaX
MKRKPATTRYQLQKITHRIEKIRKGTAFHCQYRGTGVRGAAKEKEIKHAILVELARERRHIAKGLYEIEKKGNEAIIKLTEKGAIQVLKDRIISEGRQCREGESCYVFFDIPEDIRKLRSSFRYFLKCAGFERVQRSIWASVKDVGDDLGQLVELLDISRWVKVVVGTSV